MTWWELYSQYPLYLEALMKMKMLTNDGQSADDLAVLAGLLGLFDWVLGLMSWL